MGRIVRRSMCSGLLRRLGFELDAGFLSCVDLWCGGDRMRIYGLRYSMRFEGAEGNPNYCIC